jgi:hypothetical protein
MITKLKPGQIFCFGSNLAGKHIGGGAKQAKESFGAIEGQGIGLQGQSYAIATLDESFNKVTLEFIQQQLYSLSQFAKENPDKEFLLTPIGTGIAGFSIKEIRELLPTKSLAKNIKLINW